MGWCHYYRRYTNSRREVRLRQSLCVTSLQRLVRSKLSRTESFSAPHLSLSPHTPRVPFTPSRPTSASASLSLSSSRGQQVGGYHLLLHQQRAVKETDALASVSFSFFAPEHAGRLNVGSNWARETTRVGLLLSNRRCGRQRKWTSEASKTKTISIDVMGAPRHCRIAHFLEFERHGSMPEPGNTA